MDYRIVILQRGWVAIGEYSQEGTKIKINNASIIRRWGTSKGLGELAVKGALPNTILDPCGLVEVHELAIIATIQTEASLWNLKVSDKK